MQSAAAALPERIGPFDVLSLLGDGAQGRVYLAQQHEPRREVALKVLRTAALAAEFQQRFQREIDVLARLEHPGIARVYSAGNAETPGGRVPYLAMEYVRGTDLRAHCEKNVPDTAGRLRLLALVCAAVHHAHTRGVIHRDLKPANILVDEHGQPKILDFGVAHVISGESAQMTVAGQVLGTVAYLAPELLGGGGAGADPRSDVYALGVIAYELVSGDLPYPGLSKSTVVEALGLLRKSPPQRLSVTAPSAHGDLETIVMKALAQEPAQRYASAAEFAADLQRFLERRPIEARPPSAGYVLSLFVRRHRALAAAGALVLFAVVAAALVSLRFAITEARAHREAEARLAERDAVNNFLTQMFAAADPDQAQGEKLTVRDVLDTAREQLKGSELPGTALAQLQRALGNTYVALDVAEPGLALLEAAREPIRNAYGEQSAEMMRLKVDIAHGLLAAGREGDAEKLLTEVLPQLAAATDPKERAIHISGRLEQVNYLMARGNADEAVALARETLADSEKELGEVSDDTLLALHFLSQALQQQAKTDEAIALSRTAVERLQKRYGPEHVRTGMAMEVLSLALRDAGKYDEAESLLRQTLAIRRKSLGPGHTQTWVVTANLAATLSIMGRAADAAPLVREAHAALREHLGDEAETTRSVASLHAYVASEVGALDEAAEIYRGVIAQAEKNPQGLVITDLPDYNNLGNVLLRGGHLQESRAEFEGLLEKAEKIVGKDHAHYGMFEANYGECLRKLGLFREAAAALEDALANHLKNLGAGHPRVASTRERLAQTYDALGRKADAAKLREQLAAAAAAAKTQ